VALLFAWNMSRKLSQKGRGKIAMSIKQDNKSGDVMQKVSEP
jgi:hypothetical protein